MDELCRAFQDFEVAGWEEVASAYATATEGMVAPLSAAILDAGHVRSGSRVLDVACGPGWVAALAARRGADVVGVDIAAAMVSAARARHPGLEFCQGAAEELPFDDASFDVVVSALGMDRSL